MKKILVWCGIGALLSLASCQKENPGMVGGELEGDGTFEYDGRSYVYKTIGTQTWMIENLAFIPSVSPSSDGSDSVSFYYVNGYEGSAVQEAKATSNYKTYGVLYNFEAAKAACPPGWHLPGDEEWKTLEKQLGMSSTDADAIQWRNSGSVGKKLKSGSGWINNGNGNNSSGFTALPGGDRYNLGGFLEDLGTLALFWTSSNGFNRRVWYRCLDSNFDGVFRLSSDRTPGFSVRCLKNTN
jgi:uncharacterized protein (TIGR02145 family)